MIGLQIEDIRLVFSKLWKNRLLILIVTLAGACAGLALAENVSDTYEYRATATVCVTYKNACVPAISTTLAITATLPSLKCWGTGRWAIISKKK